MSLQKARAEKLKLNSNCTPAECGGTDNQGHQQLLKDRFNSKFPGVIPVYAGPREAGQVWNSSHSLGCKKQQKSCTAQARNWSSANSSNRMRQRLFLQVPTSFTCGGRVSTAALLAQDRLQTSGCRDEHLQPRTHLCWCTGQPQQWGSHGSQRFHGRGSW